MLLYKYSSSIKWASAIGLSKSYDLNTVDLLQAKWQLPTDAITFIWDKQFLIGHSIEIKAKRAKCSNMHASGTKYKKMYIANIQLATMIYKTSRITTCPTFTYQAIRKRLQTEIDTHRKCRYMLLLVHWIQKSMLIPVNRTHKGI